MYIAKSKSQSEKAAFCMIPTIRHIRKVRTMETVKMSGYQVSWGRKGRKIGGAQETFKAVKLFCVIL